MKCSTLSSPSLQKQSVLLARWIRRVAVFAVVVGLAGADLHAEKVAS